METYVTAFYNFVHAKKKVCFRPDTDGGIIINEQVRYPPEVAVMFYEGLVALFGSVNVQTVPLEQLPLLSCNQNRAETHRQALQRGQELYVSARPCRKCKAVGLRYMRGKRCYFCDKKRREKRPSARQQAIAAGRKWYTPETPCKRCHTLAERHVINGSCKGCKATVVRQNDPDAQLMETQPDLILSRNDARTMGFKVYRTGRPCSKSHTGYRYVSTGNCIDCMRKGG